MTHRLIPPFRRAAVICCVASCAMTGVATAGEAGAVQRLLEGAAITHTAPSPDGERVAYVVSRVDSTGDARRQLYVGSADGVRVRRFTFGEAGVAAPAWSPDGRWLAYLRGGGARGSELMLMPADGGGARRISDPGVPVDAFRWSPAGDGIAFSSRAAERAALDPRTPSVPAVVVGSHRERRHLWWLRVDTAGNPGIPRRLTPEDYHVATVAGAAAFDVAPNGREIAFTHTRTPSPDDWKRADVSVVEVATGRVRTFQQSDAAEFAPHFSPDGRHIAFAITVFPPSTVGQWRVGLAERDGSGLKLLAATPDEQPRIVGWLGERTLLVEEPSRTVTGLWKLPVDGGEPRRFDHGDAVLSAVTLNASATRLAFAAMNERAPQEAAATGLRRFQPVAVSAANASLAGAAVPETRLVHWQSSDGSEIEGLLTLPAGQRSDATPALVLMIHDGPAGVASRDYPGQSGGFEPLDVLAARGFAVLRANHRGSSGYGHAFRAPSPGFWGDATHDDLMSGVDHVIAAGLADPERLAVMGWGHGAFLAGRIITRTHRFEAAVLGAPMSDLVMLRATSEASGFLVDYLGGEPWQQPDAYRDRSPLLDAHRVTTPTLILHGEADRRIPADQGLALHRLLKAQGLDTRMVLYPGASHYVSEPAQRLHAIREVVGWLERYVGDS